MLSKTLMVSAGVAGGAGAYVEDVFSTYLYTGNSSTQTITNGIDLAGEGGLVWIKQRSNTAISGGLPSQHLLFDTQRGANNMLASNSTYQNLALSGYSFNSNGFSVSQFTNIDPSGNPYEGNYSPATYASWTFRKAEKFFDVVTYTGNGSNRTISHNLGSVPGCVIVKRTDSTSDWSVYHRSLTSAAYVIYLNGLNAESSVPSAWNSTAPTSSVFSLGTTASVNASGGTYVAYLFAHDAGGFGAGGAENVISCGSYNGSAGAQEINLGFEPQWVMIKCSNTGGTSWVIQDTMREMSLKDTNYLSANTVNEENPSAPVYPTATGFGLSGGGYGNWNNSGRTYIYIAIRRGPMKTPTSGTEVFYPTGSGLPSTVVTTGFPSDVVWQYTDSSAGFLAESRIIGDSRRLQIPSTAAETTSLAWAAFSLSSMNLMTQTYFNYLTVSNLAGYAFRRAPGFFDVVCYTGTGSATTVSHNLGVAPELMIVKRRDDSGNWCVYHSSLGGTKNLYLQNSFSQQTISGMWNDTDPTSTVFTVGNQSSVNYATGTYVAYLFATISGVSKVGSYTGTGTTLQINCGFSGGARFVMIKRTDSTGDWYVWDSARGIVAGNDPYLLLNSTAAEVTSTDYIDPYSAGFEISSTAPAAINASSGTFIYLAIA